MTKIQAVIMAGGKGTRLVSVANDIPKPMVTLAGKPLLEYQIDNLRSNGIVDIIIVVGYLGDVIKRHFQNGEKYDVNITYFTESTPLGTAGALYYLKDILRDDFLLLYGDLFINVNLRRFYDYHKNKCTYATLYAHPNSHPYDSDILVVDDLNCVVEWNFKNTKRTRDYKNLVNAGVYVFSPVIMKYIGRDKKTDLEKDIIVNLIQAKKVFAYPCTEYVKDIGTPERLYKVEKNYHDGICDQKNLKNKQKCIFLDRDGTVNKHVGFMTDRSQMQLEENTADAVRLINESEYLAIVVSNQPVIARGECGYDEMDAIHNRMYTLLGEEGSYLDGLYFCPHHPDRGYIGEVSQLKIACNCRKPNTGMIMRAMQDYNIDLNESWMIGDTTMDIQTGLNAGVKTALVLTGEAGADGKYDVVPNIIGKDLLGCIKTIIGEDK